MSGPSEVLCSVDLLISEPYGYSRPPMEVLRGDGNLMRFVPRRAYADRAAGVIASPAWSTLKESR